MEALMTRREVMDVLRVSDPKTLSRWIREGRFPAGIGTGRQQLWTPEAVRAWIAAQSEVAA